MPIFCTCQIFASFNDSHAYLLCYISGIFVLLKYHFNKRFQQNQSYNCDHDASDVAGTAAYFYVLAHGVGLQN